MPKTITYAELEKLRDFDGNIPAWDSDLEEQGCSPPEKVATYIEYRDSDHKKQHDQFLADVKLKDRIRAKQKRDQREKRKAAKEKRDALDREQRQQQFAVAKARMTVGKSPFPSHCFSFLIVCCFYISYTSKEETFYIHY